MSTAVDIKSLLSLTLLPAAFQTPLVSREMPPVRNAAATRERLLEAARKRFVNESYENVGLREIAADAGVDVALIARYFGSKEQLFKEVLRKDVGNRQTLASISEPIPAYLARVVATKDASEDAVHIDRLLIMLRSASSPQASALVQSSFTEDVLEPLAELLTGPDAPRRAAIALSVLVGTTIMRTIMNVDCVQECGQEGFRTRLTAVLQAALDE